MSFEEIEDCMPDGYGCWSHDESGGLLVTAQWLHDFARAVEVMVSGACKAACEAQENGDPTDGFDGGVAACVRAIEMRSNGKLQPRTEAGESLPE